MWVAMPDALRLTHRQRCDALTASGFTATWLGICGTRDLNKETCMNAHRTTLAAIAFAMAGLAAAGTASAGVVLIDFTDSSQFGNSDLTGNYAIVGSATIASTGGSA